MQEITTNKSYHDPSWTAAFSEKQIQATPAPVVVKENQQSTSSPRIMAWWYHDYRFNGVLANKLQCWHCWHCSWIVGGIVMGQGRRPQNRRLVAQLQIDCSIYTRSPFLWDTTLAYISLHYMAVSPPSCCQQDRRPKNKNGGLVVVLAHTAQGTSTENTTNILVIIIIIIIITCSIRQKTKNKLSATDTCSFMEI